jgi:hypothetical protein
MKILLILLILLTSALFSINSPAQVSQISIDSAMSFNAIDKNRKIIQLKDLLGKKFFLFFTKQTVQFALEI